MKKRCQKCGGEFQPNKPWQKFCTRKCHDDFHNAKHYVMGGNANPEGGEHARAAYGFAVRNREAGLNGHPAYKVPLPCDELRPRAPEPRAPKLIRRPVVQAKNNEGGSVA